LIGKIGSKSSKRACGFKNSGGWWHFLHSERNKEELVKDNVVARLKLSMTEEGGRYIP